MSPLRTQHLSPSSPVFAPSHLEGLSPDLSPIPSSSFYRILSASLPGSARVVIRILKFDGSGDAVPCICIQDSIVEFSKDR